MPVSTTAETIYDLDLSAAAVRSGYSERSLRRLKDSGRLRAAKHKGRLYFSSAEVDALATPQPVDGDDGHERLVADLVASAPALSPARRARIAAAIASADRG